MLVFLFCLTQEILLQLKFVYFVFILQLTALGQLYFVHCNEFDF